MKAKSTMWWTKPKADVHTDIFEIVSKIHMSTEERRERNLRSLRLYGNMDLVGLAPYSFSTSALPSLPENRVKINIVSSMVDTVSAKISKMKPRVTFLTSGGDFSSQANAKKLSKFALGTFYKNDTYKLHQAAFRDAAVFDIGALKHYIAGEKIVSERVLATELYVDDIDAMYGNPRNMYQVKYIHKDVLGQMYPDKIASINMASNSFGNLAQRTLSFIAKNLEGRLPWGSNAETDADTDLQAFVSREIAALESDFQSLAPSDGIQSWMRAVFACNAYIDAQAPWALRKTDPARMEAVLATLYIAIGQLAVAILPVIPASATALLDQMGVPEDVRHHAALRSNWYQTLVENGFTLAAPKPLFPRLELTEADG